MQGSFYVIARKGKNNEALYFKTMILNQGSSSTAKLDEATLFRSESAANKVLQVLQFWDKKKKLEVWSKEGEFIVLPICERCKSALGDTAVISGLKSAITGEDVPNMDVCSECVPAVIHLLEVVVEQGLAVPKAAPQRERRGSSALYGLSDPRSSFRSILEELLGRS